MTPAGRTQAPETDVYLAHLALCDFRNFARLELDLREQGGLLKGPNGSGKTSILEAIHVVCVGRSQRGALRPDMIRHGAPCGSVRAVFRADDGRSIEAVFGFDRAGALSMRRDGRPVATQREWFGICAAVSFGPEDLRLLTGGPVERRRYLDVLLSQLEPAYLGHLIAYNRALASRTRVLAGAQDGRLLDEYERQMVDHGAVLHEKRRAISRICQEMYARLYGEISGGSEQASLRFASGTGAGECGSEEWVDVFSNTLKNNRKRDAEAGHSTRGCHRDNILLLLNDRPARSCASQGQLRSMALALRLCAVHCLAQVRRDSMLLLVDDAFSELDDQRIARVYPRVRECGQVFMATPVDRVPVELAMPQYRVCDGTVSAL